MSEYLGFQPVSEEYICSGKPFYFVSYNSQDVNYVIPILMKLHEMGVPLWYDYGIPYNSKWTGVIANKIRRCKSVLFFLTWGIITKVGPNGEDPYTMKEYKIAKRSNKEIFVNLIDQIDSVNEFDRIPDDKVEFIIDIEGRQSIPVFKDPENLDWIANEICNAIGFVPKGETVVASQENVSIESNQILVEAFENPDVTNTASKKSGISSSFHIENGVLRKFVGTETEVVIPDGVTSIGDFAFAYCEHLSNVTVPGSMIIIGSSAFKSCESLTSVIIPNSVTSIGGSAFESCKSLTSVTIPNSITNIGRYVFSSCINLTNIIIPNSVTRIGVSAFSKCKSLTDIIIPNSVTNIGAFAFNSCESLTNIIVPGSVTSVGDLAFKSCENLISVTILNGMTSIGKNAFFGCDNLKEIFYTGTKEQWDNLDIQLPPAVKIHYSWGCTCNNDDNKIDISPEKSTPLSSFQIENGVLIEFVGKETEVVIPDGVTSIGNKAFMLCKSLTSVTIPDSVTNIGDSAFYSCESLTSITIPNSVTSIGDDTFVFCKNMTDVTIPSSVTSIGTYVFWSCESLKEIFYAGTKKQWDSLDVRLPLGVKIHCSKVYPNDNNGDKMEILPKRYTPISSFQIKNGVLRNFVGKETEVVIPDGVTSIGNFAFNSCESLTSITIPDGVTSIGNFAFDSCESLTSITIPDGVTSIGDYAFSNCSSLTSITIPDGVKNVGKNAFSGCGSLTSITIPDGVTSIGDWIFYKCKSLTSITIPDGVTSIGNYAFNSCESLDSITIPDGVTSIRDSAFCNCKSLTNITISGGVTSVGKDAFWGCSSLTSITIPNGVTSIGKNAFSYCDNLKEIFYTGTEKQWKKLKFGRHFKRNVKIHFDF